MVRLGTRRSLVMLLHSDRLPTRNIGEPPFMRCDRMTLLSTLWWRKRV